MSGRGGRVVVVGAGVAGLTLSYLLASAGREVLLVEKSGTAGGLARSFSYDGFIFDIGPHRFHTDIVEVDAFIRETLEDRYIEMERKSGVWMFGRYFDWPLSAGALLKMPRRVLFSIGLDALRGKKKGGESFEDYIIGKYGKTLYRVFFKPYTEKFLQMPCSEVSKDWAVTGIERALIDKKIRASDLFEFAKSVFLTVPPLKFIYPKGGGIGVFADVLTEKIKKNGGSVLLGAAVEGMSAEGGLIRGVSVGGRRYECDAVVWTGPVDEAVRLLGGSDAGLEYLSLMLYNYQVDHPPLTGYQWCYYGSGDIPFSRVSVPCLFDPALAPQGKSGLCVEAPFKNETDPLAAEPLIRKAMAEVGLINGADSIIGLNVERISHAYPVYALDYADRRRSAMTTASEFKNLKLLGRTGTFWYNNMDHSIMAAMELFRELTD